MADRFRRYAHKPDEVVVILANGTLLDVEPVERMIDAGLKLDKETLVALKKTLELRDA